MHTYTLVIESFWYEGDRKYFAFIALVVKSQFGEVYRNSISMSSKASSDLEALELMLLRLKYMEKFKPEWVQITDLSIEVDNTSEEFMLIADSYLDHINATVFADEKSKNFF